MGRFTLNQILRFEHALTGSACTCTSRQEEMINRASKTKRKIEPKLRKVHHYNDINIDSENSQTVAVLSVV